MPIMPKITRMPMMPIMPKITAHNVPIMPKMPVPAGPLDAPHAADRAARDRRAVRARGGAATLRQQRPEVRFFDPLILRIIRILILVLIRNLIHQIIRTLILRITRSRYSPDYPYPYSSDYPYPYSSDHPYPYSRDYPYPYSSDYPYCYAYPVTHARRVVFVPPAAHAALPPGPNLPRSRRNLRVSRTTR